MNSTSNDALKRPELWTPRRRHRSDIGFEHEIEHERLPAELLQLHTLTEVRYSISISIANSNSSGVHLAVDYFLYGQSHLMLSRCPYVQQELKGDFHHAHQKKRHESMQRKLDTVAVLLKKSAQENLVSYVVANSLASLTYHA